MGIQNRKLKVTEPLKKGFPQIGCEYFIVFVK